MDTLYVHDTLTQIKTVIDTVHKIDTLYAFATKREFSDPFKEWFPLISAYLTLLGWFIVSRLNRNNSLKSFEEGVLDKIRIEINMEIHKYSKWIDDFHLRFSLYMNVFNEHIITEDEDLRNVILADAFGNLKNVFLNYYQLFSQIMPVFDSLEKRHQKMFSDTHFLYNTKALGNDFSREELTIQYNMILDQKIYIGQFFDILQYDCLSSIRRVQAFGYREEDGCLFFKNENDEREYYFIPRFRFINIMLSKIANFIYWLFPKPKIKTISNKKYEVN